MVKRKKYIRSINLYGYLCFLFSFPIIADSLMGITYSINISNYSSIIYFIFQGSAGLWLGILGFSMVITSKLYEKLDDKIIKKMLDLSDKYTNQITTLKIFIIFTVFFITITISFQYIGVIFGISISILASALFFQILLKTLK